MGMMLRYLKVMLTAQAPTAADCFYVSNSMSSTMLNTVSLFKTEQIHYQLNTTRLSGHLLHGTPVLQIGASL